MTSPDPSIATLRASHERLRSLVEPLSVEQLGVTSFCDDWSIAQVLSHLGSQAVILGTFLDAAVAGDPEPSNDSFPAVWDRWNAMSAEEQRTEHLAASQAALERLEGLSSEQLRDVEVSLFGGYLHVDPAGFARVRLVEHAIHTWDIAVALDAGATIAPDAAAILVPELGRVVARFAEAAGHLRLRLELTDPQSTWLLAPADEGLVPWDDQAVSGTLAATTDEVIRLLFGRVRPSDQLALDAGDLTVADLQQAFPGT